MKLILRIMRKYKTFRVIVSVGNEEEKEKCYYCNSEGKAKEHALKEFGKAARILYVEEILV